VLLHFSRTLEYETPRNSFRFFPSVQAGTRKDVSNFNTRSTELRIRIETQKRCYKKSYIWKLLNVILSYEVVRYLFSQTYDLWGSLHALLTLENTVIVRMLE
jgi:hypothetical protein